MLNSTYNDGHNNTFELTRERDDLQNKLDNVEDLAPLLIQLQNDNQAIEDAKNVIESNFNDKVIELNSVKAQIVETRRERDDFQFKLNAFQDQIISL